MIVSTSTLELGIDIGDLDRMIQLDAPRCVGSFLQRLGRTGRRAGTARNALFLATDQAALLRSAGLLHLWSTGFVEPVVAPPSPRHIAAQQFLALALQEGRFARASWHEWWAGNPVMMEGEIVLDHLVEVEFLAEDGGWLFIGPTAEREFGGRNFLDLLSTFLSGLELTVIHGQKEIGWVSPMSLSKDVLSGSMSLLLGGRSWKLLDVDWQRHRVRVEPDESPGRARWSSDPLPESFEMVRARREVLLGADPPISLTSRAAKILAEVRADWASRVHTDGIVIERGTKEVTLWGMAGLRAHETLAAALPVAFEPRSTNEYIRFSDQFDIIALRTVAPVTSLPHITQGQSTV